MWQIILDISSLISQIATTIIAGFATWIAYLTFLRIPEQEHEDVPNLENQEIIKELDQLVIFQTQNQRTTLKVTSDGVECQLFDARPGKSSGLQWMLGSDEISRIIENKDYHVNEGIKFKTGTLSIGKHRNWLYSKILFPNSDELENQITRLLKQL